MNAQEEASEIVNSLFADNYKPKKHADKAAKCHKNVKLANYHIFNLIKHWPDKDGRVMGSLEDIQAALYCLQEVLEHSS